MPRLARIAWIGCAGVLWSASPGCEGESKPASEGIPAPAAGSNSVSATAVESASGAAGEGESGEPEGLPADVLAALNSPPRLVAAAPVKVLPESVGECPDERDPNIGVMVSPRVPSRREPLRVLVADLGSEDPMAVSIRNSDEETMPGVEVTAYAGVPAYSVVSFTPAKHGKYTVAVGREGKGLRCREFWVAKYPKKREFPEPDLEQVWTSRRHWDLSEEALFSAWVQGLFRGDPSEDLAWGSLDELTSDPTRNLLHDHYGWEDGREDGLALRPDCADLPYYLRGYFSWKRKLPFGFHRCSRGNERRGPSCHSRATIAEAPELKEAWTLPEAEFTERDVIERYFQRTLAWGVHTGNGRVGHEATLTDFYPVAIDRRSIRPGTVYADPYGHILVVAEFIPGLDGRPGILFAVDGQPDASITRKRFSEGNFLWNPDPKHGGSGFKAFRPLAWADADGPPPGWPEGEPVPERLLTPLDDNALKKAGYDDRSLDDTKLAGVDFYDRVETLITPEARNPYLALREAVSALAEAARIRVTSVQNAEKWLAEQKAGAEIEMPWGYGVFQAVGAWENFSTPARDLRLLLAMDVVSNFEGKLRRSPQSFGIEAADVDAIAVQLDAARSTLLARDDFAFEYVRSDGSPWRLTLADLLSRAERFEMAYNPNDCPEHRWGAEPGSDEYAPCKRRAPESQRKQMTAYRSWFSTRTRPPRGDDGPDVPGVERPPEEED